VVTLSKEPRLRLGDVDEFSRLMFGKRRTPAYSCGAMLRVRLCCTILGKKYPSTDTNQSFPNGLPAPLPPVHQKKGRPCEGRIYFYHASDCKDKSY